MAKMASNSRPRMAPICTACLRGYAFGLLPIVRSSGLQQQIRGKKKMPNNSGTMTVRLLKDVNGYGRRGALVPISPGAMRNQWFPGRIAEYVTAPELKRFRLSNVPMTRDFQFGQTTPDEGPAPNDANAIWQQDIPGDIKAMSTAELRSASDLERANIESGMTDTAPRKLVEVEKLTPKRSMELVELFVPQRLEFYRQPIVEEKQPEEPEKPVPVLPQYEGVGGDLLAARSRQSRKAREKPQGIYGSVSAHDVLVAMRAVMADNDEAARVILQESDIQLIDLLQVEGSEAGRLKHIGDFVVEIKMKGVEKSVSRTIRIVPQDPQRL